MILPKETHGDGGGLLAPCPCQTHIHVGREGRTVAVIPCLANIPSSVTPNTPQGQLPLRL